MASLARLAALLPSSIAPGHGEPVEDPRSKLAEYRRHRLERERQILRALRAGASTLEEIREAVYGALESGLHRPAERSILAHLAHLKRANHELPAAVAALPEREAQRL